MPLCLSFRLLNLPRHRQEMPITTTVALLFLLYSCAHFWINRSIRKAKFLTFEKVSPPVLTVDSEQHTGIAHPHHVLSNAGEQESIVLAGDIHQGQIDGMNIGPVEVGLKIPERNTDRNRYLVASFLPSTTPRKGGSEFRSEEVSKI